MRDRHNVIPVTLAVLLHVVVFGSLVVAIDLVRNTQPPVPLAIKGMLVTDNAVVLPPAEPEAVAPEPEPAPPEPQPSAEERAALEEQKRLEDARIEAERVERIRQQEAEQARLAAEAERKRKAEEERRRQAEEEQRRREAEAEKERQRLEAERKRQEEIERQRAENERLRQEAEAARQAEIAAEAQRLEAMQANAQAAYMFAIRQHIQRHWVRPPTATVGIECVVNIRQLPGGEVVSVSIGSCNGDAAVRSSIERAVYKASPLPSPRDPSVFSRDLRLIFRPEE